MANFSILCSIASFVISKSSIVQPQHRWQYSQYLLICSSWMSWKGSCLYFTGLSKFIYSQCQRDFKEFVVCQSIKWKILKLKDDSMPVCLENVLQAMAHEVFAWSFADLEIRALAILPPARESLHSFVFLGTSPFGAFWRSKILKSAAFWILDEGEWEAIIVTDL